MMLRSEFHFYNFIPAIFCIAGIVIRMIGDKKNNTRAETVGLILTAVGFCLTFVLC